MLKNYGLDLAKEKLEQSTDDWKFGAIGEDLAIIPENERMKYLPIGEVQKGQDDLMDCASRGPLNILETKFNFLLKNKKLSFENEMWLKEKGYITNDGVEFSDAYIAILSGTTRQGNSLKAPLEAIRKNGLIPKSVLPLKSDMTWEQYHDPNRIMPLMKMLGEDFMSRFHINYEKVFEKSYPKLIKTCMLNVAGFAWPEPINGEYQSVNQVANHCFIVVRSPLYLIFDNYPDSFDGDFIKKLANDYDLLDYGYRLSVNQKAIVPKKPFLRRLKEGLGLYFYEIFRA